jgi:hypothetical protein
MTGSRYNIALLPRHPEVYTKLARECFARNAEGYLLGSDSLPHITLCQFMSEPSVLLLLREVLGRAGKTLPIQLTGLRLSNKDGDAWGVSISTLHDKK